MLLWWLCEQSGWGGAEAQTWGPPEKSNQVNVSQEDCRQSRPGRERGRVSAKGTLGALWTAGATPSVPVRAVEGYSPSVWVANPPHVEARL